LVSDWLRPAAEVSEPVPDWLRQNGTTNSGLPMRWAGSRLPNGGVGEQGPLGRDIRGKQLIGEVDTNVWALPSNESGNMVTVYCTVDMK